VTGTGDLDQYGVAFFYDPRYHVEDPEGDDEAKPIGWFTSRLLDAVLRAEASRTRRGGPYTHVCLSAHPKKIDVRKGGVGAGSNARFMCFTNTDHARGFDVYPHLDQESMGDIFEAARRVVSPADPDPEWRFHTPSLLWLMVIGLLAEGRLTLLAQVLAHLVPNFRGVFCTEMVADAFRRFSPSPFYVYADEARIRRLQLTFPKSVFLARVRRLAGVWGVDAQEAVEPESAWQNFQGLDVATARVTDAWCGAPPTDDRGRHLVPIGNDVGQIPPHLVGLSEIANSPCLRDPIGLPRAGAQDTPGSPST
jgi:hypothetical protein